MTERKAISVRDMPVDLWQALRLESFKTGKTVTEILIDAIKSYLREKP